jgi:multiple sugar transport system permease protein
MTSRQILFVPLFLIIKKLGLQGTRIAVILPLVFSPVSIFLFKSFVDGIPKDLIDSARIDGAKERQILTRIMVPICKPVIAVIMLSCFMNVMGDYLWQMLLLQDEGKKTLLVGLLGSVMRQGRHFSQPNPIGLQLAAGVILFIPVFVVFCFFQKYFIKGISFGGVKE